MTEARPDPLCDRCGDAWPEGDAGPNPPADHLDVSQSL